MNSMRRHGSPLPTPGKAGFTLAEILLAMLVFAIAISTILALLARSIETVDEILLKDEAMRLSGAVENYMEEMPFTEAYGAVQAGEDVFAYFYRGDPGGTPRADGSLPPKTDTVDGSGNALVAGEDYVVVPAVRQAGPELNQDVAARESRIFQVRMTVSPANPFGINLPADPNAVDGSGNPMYDSAVLVVYAEYYPVPSINYNLPDDPEFNPVYSYNFAVRR